MKISSKVLIATVLINAVDFNNPLYCMDKTYKSQYYIEKENKYNYVKKENKHNKHEMNKLMNEIYDTSSDEYDNDDSFEFENYDNYSKNLHSSNKKNKFHCAQKENKYKKRDASHLEKQTNKISNEGKVKNKLQQQNIITNEESKQKLNINVVPSYKDNKVFTSIENTANNIKLNNDNNIKLNNIVNNINDCKNDIVIKKSNNTNEINNKISEKKRIEEELLKDNINKMYDTYYDNDEISEEENKELIKKLYNYLFGNNCHNLKISFGVEEALEQIWELIQDNDIKNYFINSFKSKDDNELNTISNAFNNNNNSEEYNNIKYYINYYIHQGRLMRLLNMDITFKEMLDGYNNAWEKNDDTKRMEYVEQFCDYLLGNDGKNLETILSYNGNIGSGLSEINKFLQEYNVTKYLSEKLKHSNDLYHNVSNIVSNILYPWYDKRNNTIDDVIDNIKSCILLKSLGMNSTFCEMWINDLTEDNKIEQVLNVLFGNNGRNLETILYCNCKESKNVWDVLKQKKVEEHLIDFLKEYDIKHKILQQYIDKDVLHNTALKFDVILNECGDEILNIINNCFWKSEGSHHDLK